MLEQIWLLLIETLLGENWFKYWSIPVIAGGIGWITNWLAIKLTFYPLEFVGIKPWLGWQGIIPSKVEKMAKIVVDQAVSKLGTLQEFFHEMEPEEIANYLIQVIMPRVEAYTDEVMLEKNAVLWENLPIVLKDRMYQHAQKQVPNIISNLVDDVADNIEHLVDLRHMVISQLVADKVLMNRVFQQVGKKEFQFVIMSGFLFGLPLGLIQMFVWILYPQNWVLPAFGFVVGYVTNWVALNVIFRPLHPKMVHLPLFGKFRLQGLFLKRQEEVAKVFCWMISSEVLTLQNLMNEMLAGPKSERTRGMIKKHLKTMIEGSVVKFIAQLTIGPNGYVDLKRSIEDKALSISADYFEDTQFNHERAKVVAELFEKRMSALSPEEFQSLLRPAFKEDEWILIAVGAALGGLAGLLQLIFVFGMNSW